MENMTHEILRFRQVLPETVIVVDIDGTTENLIVRKFGNRIFSKSEKAKILRDIFTSETIPMQVIFGGVDNIIDSYYKTNNTVRPARDAKEALFDIPGKNNFQKIYDDIHSEIIETLKISGFFKGLVSDYDIDSVVEYWNVAITLPYDKTTVLDIRNRYLKAGLPYGIDVDAIKRNIFTLHIKIPCIINTEPLIVRL